jgi:hypothetical protein
MRNEIVLIVATLGLLPVASRAQESGGAVACPSIQNDQDRLACYDRAMRGAPRVPAPTATPAPASAPAPVPTSVVAPAVVGAATVGAAAATANGAPASAAPAAAEPSAATTTSSAASAPSTSNTVAAVPAAPAAVTGAAVGTAAAAHAAETSAAPAATSSATISTAPHSPRNTTAATPPQPGAPPTFDPSTGAPIGIVPVVVLSTLSRPGFGTEFTTDKGGVWIQTEVKPLPNLPKTPFNAELQPGKFGGTFLVVTDRKLGIRVRPPNK